MRTRRSFSHIKLTPRGQIITLTCILILICAAAQGCRNNRKIPDRTPARELYTKSIRLLRTYTDSTLSARDSASLNGLSNRFDKQLTQLNYAYPAETSLMFTEGENDTIAKLTAKYVAARDSLLYRFAHPLALPDTLATDSLASDTTFISQRAQSKSSLN